MPYHKRLIFLSLKNIYNFFLINKKNMESIRKKYTYDAVKNKKVENL